MTVVNGYKEKRSLREGYSHEYMFSATYQEPFVCPSCSFICFSPCSAFLRNPLPGGGHWVCLCSDDHCGDSCDYLSTPSEESAREEDQGGRHWTVRTEKRESLLGKLVKCTSIALLNHWLGPYTKHLQCKTASMISNNWLLTCSQNRAPGWTSFGVLISLLPFTVAPHSEKHPAVVVVAGSQSLCSFLREPNTAFTTHLACLFSYHSTSFYMLCMLEVTQKVTLLLRMSGADLVFFFVFFFLFL